MDAQIRRIIDFGLLSVLFGIVMIGGWSIYTVGKFFVEHGGVTSIWIYMKALLLYLSKIMHFVVHLALRVIIFFAKAPLPLKGIFFIGFGLLLIMSTVHLEDIISRTKKSTPR
jgi:hypothetical protein